MSATLLLDQDIWDLCKDASGNIARATAPYAQAQDVASAVKLFLGELYYDTSKGIPYFSQVLGRAPAPPFLRAQIVAAALSVPGVISAVCYLTGFTGRRVSGQVQFTTSNGVSQVVEL